MQFAVLLWESDDWAGKMEFLRAQGVTALETCAKFIPECDDEAATASGEAARRAGIEIYSCHVPFDGDCDLSAADETMRRNVVDSHIASIRRTSLAGAKCMVIHPGVGLTDPAEAPMRRDKLLVSIEALLPEAERYGVTLALENMAPNWLCNNSDELMMILDKFDSPQLGACMDTGHAHMTTQGVQSTLEAMGDRIVNFHLHDNNGSWDQHLQPPYGTIDWEPLVKVIKGMNFAHPITIESASSRLVSFATVLRDAHGLFEQGFLTVEVDGKKMRVICSKCGRYCYGTKDDWFCACE